MYKHLEIATKPNYFLKFELLQVRVPLNITRNCSYLHLLEYVSYLFLLPFPLGVGGTKGLCRLWRGSAEKHNRSKVLSSPYLVNL